MDHKILVVRNDKIGDFMLAWPSFAMLKLSMPDSEIHALVPAYTQPLAELCPWIDQVIIDPGSDSDKAQSQALLEQVKQQDYSDYICLFSNMRNARLGFQAGISNRLAPATKLAQFLFNNRLKQNRSESAKAEYQYNLDLISHFLAQQEVAQVEYDGPYLSFSELCRLQRKLELIYCFDKGIKRLCFVHAGSGGSANNLSVSQYAELIERLSESLPDMGFVLTAGPGERAQADKLLAQLKPSAAVYLFESKGGLKQFCENIAAADLFIAGSTGPLHIAGACDVPSVGFFPAKRSAKPLRWTPLNSEGRHIFFAPPEGKENEEDMSLIEVDQVCQSIVQWYSY